ncbi:hypothetical protein EYV94_26230 [Puteibacter caeruleilacunae]|nr:hypothetical protein EYV94_26230 [Puteibacter caeruleilacunae]
MMKNITSIVTILLMCSAFIVSCSDDDNNEEFQRTPHDPNSPIELSTFYPDSGGIATKIILKGKNLGIDADRLKIYFNEKPGKVIESTGDLVYGIVPKQPGDMCTVSLVHDGDSIVYDNKFKYITQINVSTIAGSPGANDIKDGSLAEAWLPQPRYICVDDEKNIFVTQIHWHTMTQINEEKNQVVTLMRKNGLTYPNAPCVAPDQSVIVPLDGGNTFYQFDPQTQWSPRKVNPQVKSGTENFTITYKHSLALRYSTGMLYTRAYDGKLAKINPVTKERELVDIDLLPGSDSFLQFDPKDDKMLYISYAAKHCIYTYNVETGEHELFAGEQNVPGYIDGERDFTRFNNPHQLCFDEDGNIYVADTKNHCIRKIDKKGIVSAVVGVPQISGYVDGDPEVAMFKQPYGVAIDKDGIIYVADTGNKCVRKLAIE